MIAYNRKINAPIKFLYYLEVFDLFILLVTGVLAPLFISTFLPVNIPLWHSLIWFAGVFFLLVIVKVGRAPGFLLHWLPSLKPAAATASEGRRRGVLEKGAL